jgi:hypothetical protein
LKTCSTFSTIVVNLFTDWALGGGLQKVGSSLVVCAADGSLHHVWRRSQPVAFRYTSTLPNPPNLLNRKPCYKSIAEPSLGMYGTLWDRERTSAMFFCGSRTRCKDDKLLKSRYIWEIY